MYLVGQGHDHLGPGTSMVQRIDWTPAQERQLRGLGCTGQFDTEFAGDCKTMSAGAGLGCSCGGTCGGCGLGLFDGGLDPTTWGLPEWGIVGLGVYMVISTVFTTGRAARRVRALPGERRKRRAAALRKEASELTRKR